MEDPDLRTTGDNRSLYDRIVQRRNAAFAEEPDGDFVRTCGLSPNPLLAARALKLRELIAGLVAASKPAHILAAYRLETDLGLSPADSLNLLDLALDIQRQLSLRFSDADLERLAEMNRQDAEVRELVSFVLGLDA